MTKESKRVSKPFHFNNYSLVVFVFKSLLGIAKQWSREKFAILTPKPRNHGRILIFRGWVIVPQGN